MTTPYDPLTPSDFPLFAIGSTVYRCMASSLLFTAPNDVIAADLAYRLNAHEAGKAPVSHWTPMARSRSFVGGFIEYPILTYR